MIASARAERRSRANRKLSEVEKRVCASTMLCSSLFFSAHDDKDTYMVLGDNIFPLGEGVHIRETSFFRRF